MKKVKQISYIVAIMITIGSTIGAGIFFKNDTIFRNAGGSLALMIASWVVSGFGVLAIGLALIEVNSASKTDAGVMEWIKNFTPKWLSRFADSYMILVYLPLNYVALPIYSAMALQDIIQALNPNIVFSGWYVAIIAFGLFIWFTMTGFFKIKFAEKSQIIFGSLQFLPLIIIVILSLVDLANNGAVTSKSTSANGITGFSPWLGIIASIPAILFAIDGFYTVTSLKSNLKDEKKLGSIVAVSIALTIGIYLIFAIALGLNGYGSYLGVSFIENYAWLKTIINVLILFAILGIINGYGMVCGRIYYETYQKNKIGITNLLMKFLKIKDLKLATFWTSIVIATFFYVLLIPIGMYVWNDTGSYLDQSGNPIYGATAGNLYELTDLITNFTSMIIFIFIGCAIFGAILNRRTNKVEVTKSRGFLTFAWISFIFIVAGGSYMFIAGFVDMFGVNGADVKTSIVKFVVMLGTTIIGVTPQIYERFWGKTKRNEAVNIRS